MGTTKLPGIAHLPLAIVLVSLLCGPSAMADHPGAHASYFLGAQTETGFSHGLEFGVVPALFKTKHHAPRDSISSDSGYLVALCGGLGLGDTPSYLSVEGGAGVSSAFGLSLSGGPMLLLGDPGVSYGATARLAIDIFFVNVGIRVFDAYGATEGNRIGGLLTLGLGRY